MGQRAGELHPWFGRLTRLKKARRRQGKKGGDCGHHRPMVVIWWLSTGQIVSRLNWHLSTAPKFASFPNNCNEIYKENQRPSADYRSFLVSFGADAALFSQLFWLLFSQISVNTVTIVELIWIALIWSRMTFFTFHQHFKDWNAKTHPTNPINQEKALATIEHFKKNYWYTSIDICYLRMFQKIWIVPIFKIIINSYSSSLRFPSTEISSGKTAIIDQAGDLFWLSSSLSHSNL